MNFSTLAQWLTWLEGHHPSEIDLGLARITQVAARLDLLAPRAQVVTVAGTNGKGSCVTAIAALARAAGLRVGVYMSPHIHRYNERIMLEGAPAADADIVDAFAAIYAACNQSNPAISLTYFEYGTLAALYVFAQNNIDLVVLEVGLGGRLDAVNLIDADVAVVTSIDIDHQDWLGDTRELIGREKAGVYRAARPAICADRNPPKSLIDHAASIGAELQAVGDAFDYVSDELANTWRWRNQQSAFSHQPLPQLPLPSMAAALQAVSALGIEVSQQSFECLAALRVEGRFQSLAWRGQQWLLDVAHNPAATAFLQGKLASWREAHPQARVIGAVAMMADKDRLASLANLTASIDEWHLIALQDNPRAATPAQLTADLAQLGVTVQASGDLIAVLEGCQANARAEDVILVFGSFFTVAALLEMVAAEANPS